RGRCAGGAAGAAAERAHRGGRCGGADAEGDRGLGAGAFAGGGCVEAGLGGGGGGGGVSSRRWLDLSAATDTMAAAPLEAIRTWSELDPIRIAVISPFKIKYAKSQKPGMQGAPPSTKIAPPPLPDQPTLTHSL